MGIESLEQPCVFIEFNLRSMAYLGVMEKQPLDPLIKTPGNRVREKTTDSHLGNTNGPQGDLEIIGELTYIWLRTADEYEPLKKDIVHSKDNVTLRLFYEDESEMYQAYGFAGEQQGSSSSMLGEAIAARKVKIGTDNLQMF
jgi:hypothetical protein